MEDRLTFLESEFYKFEYLINPYHIQPGLLLDVDITSIKRKKATLDGMANVLNEFLHGVSKGFQDAAFASFSRRRSTIREDISQTFGETEEEGGAAAESTGAGADYLDLLNKPEAAPKPAGGKAPRGRKKGVVDVAAKPKTRGRRGRPPKSDGLKEI